MSVPPPHRPIRCWLTAALTLVIAGAGVALAPGIAVASRAGVPPVAAEALAQPGVVTWPHPVTVTATFHDATGPVAGQWGRLQSRPAGADRWRRVPHVGSRETDANGQVSFRVRPVRAGFYRVYFPAAHGEPATHSSSSAVVKVQPRVRLRLPGDVPELQPLHLDGTLAPAHHGLVRIQQRDGQGWHTIATAHAHQGRFSPTVRFHRLGGVRLRAVVPYDGRRMRSTSPVVRTQVINRDLREGDHGPDVRWLQRRLKALHYDVGAVNGTFGFDTLHAVTAFEKVQRLPDDGVVGAKVWAALANPRRLHLHHPIPGVDAVEVNLTHQVVILARDAKVWRILDSSTGGGYTYTDSSGQSEQAVTPTGHFTVQYRRDGWVHSRLGYLYRPAYFTDTGYAIHGETDVPPYPASHGCVRITVPAMDRYTNFFTVGESVWIYGNPPPGHE